MYGNKTPHILYSTYTLSQIRAHLLHEEYGLYGLQVICLLICNTTVYSYTQKWNMKSDEMIVSSADSNENNSHL